MTRIPLSEHADNLHRLADSFDSKFWVQTTVLSRLMVVTAMMISNLLVVDHFPGDDVPSYDCEDMCQSTNSPLAVVQILLSSFTKWDSSHYLTIATDGKFKQDKHLAFYPLYPSIIRQTAMALWLFTSYVSWIFVLLLNLLSASPLRFVSQRYMAESITGFTIERDIFSPETPMDQTYCYVVVASILVSNVSFILSVWVLRQILLIITRERTFLSGIESIGHNDVGMKVDTASITQQNRKRAAKSVSLNASRSKIVDYALLSFICNPANVFFSSAYTESFYSLLTFTAVWLIELSSCELHDGNLRYRNLEALSDRDGREVATEDVAITPKISKTSHQFKYQKEAGHQSPLDSSPYGITHMNFSRTLHLYGDENGDEELGLLIPDYAKRSMYTVTAGIFFFLAASTRSNGLLNSVFTFLIVTKRIADNILSFESVCNSSADGTFCDAHKSSSEHAHMCRNKGTKIKGGIGDIGRVISSGLQRCVTSAILLCLLLSAVTPYYIANEYIRDLLCDKETSSMWSLQYTSSNRTQLAHASNTFTQIRNLESTVWNLRSTVYHVVKRAAPAAHFYQKSIGMISGSGLGAGSNRGAGTGAGSGSGQGIEIGTGIGKGIWSNLEEGSPIEKCCVSDFKYLTRKYSTGGSDFSTSPFSSSLPSFSPSPSPPPLLFPSPYLSFFHFSNYYSAVQRAYWNVGFLRYYKVKQIPNFLLASPIVCVSIFTLVTLSYRLYSFHSDNTKEGKNKTFKLLSSSYYRSLHNAMRLSFVCATSCVGRHLIHLLLVTLVGLLVAHVQITTRLICSSCPIIYIGFATLFSPSPSDIAQHDRYQKGGVEENEKRKRRRKKKKKKVEAVCCASLISVVAKVEEKSESKYTDRLISKRRKRRRTASIAITTMTSEDDKAEHSNSGMPYLSYIRNKLRRVREGAPYLVMSYLLLFNILGVLLHPNFYPWT